MNITPTRQKHEDDGLDGEGEGTSVSTSATSEGTLHQSISSTWTQARMSDCEGPDSHLNHVPTIGRMDGLELNRRPLDPHRETLPDTVYQSVRPPLPSMATVRSSTTKGPLQVPTEDSDYLSSKNSPKPGIAVPNSSPCPTAHLAMPDVMHNHDQNRHEHSDSQPRSSLAGPSSGSSHILPSSQSSTRTRLPAYLVSDNPDVDNDLQDEQARIHSLSHSTYTSHWTPPSSPSFPDSDSESVSSFPSVSSSFFFSSAGASPHLAGIPDDHQSPDDRHASGGGSQAAPTRRRSRQGLHLGGYPRNSSRAHSRGRSGPTGKNEHASQLSLENLSHSQKPIPLPERKSGSRSRPSIQKDTTMDLAIPTLSLPAALPRPTQFGQTLGRIRVVLLSDSLQDSKSDSVAEEAIESVMQTLIWDNEDIIDAGEWEQIEGGSLGKVQLLSVHASTDWSPSKQPIPHSQSSFYSDEKSEKFEGNENIEIIRVSGILSPLSVNTLTARLKRLLLSPYHRLSSLLLPSLSLSIDNQDDDDGFDITAALARLLASSDSTPLFTALVTIVDPRGPSDLLKPLLQELSSFVPIVLLPRSSHNQATSSRSHRHPSFISLLSKVKLSAFAPTSPHSLLVGLFRGPETLKKLRMEAVERFLKWREVEGEVARALAASSGIPLSSSYLNDSISSETQHPLELIQLSNGKRVGLGVRLDIGKSQPKWQEWKQQWETEWMESFSVDVASRLREERSNQQTSFGTPGSRKRVRTNEIQDSSPFRGEVEGEVDRPSSPSFLVPLSPRLQSTSLPSDPLHLPSLIVLSLSLLGPLKQRLMERIRNVFAILWDSVPVPATPRGHDSHSCQNCGSAFSPRWEHDIASRTGHHRNRRLVIVGIGGLIIGVGIGLCAR